MTPTPVHAIFHRQISGDQALLRLAQERCKAAGLGPEFYPGSPAELRHEQQFHPGQPPLYGPVGLGKIVAAARRTASAGGLTMTLEVHAPVPAERRDLGEYRRLFGHWGDLTNAERMNHWVDILLRNHRLVRKLLGER